jgi:hypothetical protein
MEHLFMWTSGDVISEYLLKTKILRISIHACVGPVAFAKEPKVFIHLRGVC